MSEGSYTSWTYFGSATPPGLYDERVRITIDNMGYVVAIDEDHCFLCNLTTFLSNIVAEGEYIGWIDYAPNMTPSKLHRYVPVIVYPDNNVPILHVLSRGVDIFSRNLQSDVADLEWAQDAVFSPNGKYIVVFDALGAPGYNGRLHIYVGS